MSRDRLLYTRAAKVRLGMLPAEVRVHLETHLENLALLTEATPDRLPAMLERDEDGFVTAARSLLIYRIESFSRASRGAAAAWVPPR